MQWCGAVAPTSSCRTSVGVAVLEGALYAVGGQDGVQCLNHVERYEPKDNRWTKVLLSNATHTLTSAKHVAIVFTLVTELVLLIN